MRISFALTRINIRNREVVSYISIERFGLTSFSKFEADVEGIVGGLEGVPADAAERRRIDEEFDRAEEMAVQGINSARFRMGRSRRADVARLRNPGL